METFKNATACREFATVCPGLEAADLGAKMRFAWRENRENQGKRNLAHRLQHHLRMVRIGGKVGKGVRIEFYH